MKWLIPSLRLRLVVALVISIAGALAGSVVANPAHAAPAYTVSVGYADNLRAGAANFPTPWQGDPNTVFVGNGGTWDAGAIRIDNNTGGNITINDVSVNVPCSNSVPHPVDLWGSNVLGPGQSLILTETVYDNFDTSDFGCTPCGVPDTNPANAPTVTVTENGITTSYTDTARVLDTYGYDLACLHNESIPWAVIGQAAGTTNTLSESPPAQTRPLGGTGTVIGTLLDASNNPVPNVTVNFTVLSGPDAGATGSGVTDSSGNAYFTYTNNGTPGTDVIQACVTNAAGTFCTGDAGQGANVTITWVACVAPTITLKSVTTNGSGQKVLTFAVQDPATGLDAGMTLSGSNILAPTTNPNPYFNGTTSEVDAIFTKANQALSSSSTVTATSGPCSASKDPLLTSTMRQQGKPQTDTYSGIAQSESLLTVYNGAPGVENMKLSVNGKSFMLHAMKDGDQQSVSIASALTSGNNTISVTSTGRPGGSAVLLVAPPK